jgi:hypothetical protein
MNLRAKYIKNGELTLDGVNYVINATEFANGDDWDVNYTIVAAGDADPDAMTKGAAESKETGGWDLPTILELEEMHRLLKTKGGFNVNAGAASRYWSSSTGYKKTGVPGFYSYTAQGSLFKAFSDTTWDSPTKISDSNPLYVDGYEVDGTAPGYSDNNTGNYGYTSNNLDVARVRLVRDALTITY